MDGNMNKTNIYCMVDESMLCCECGNCPPDDEEDLYFADTEQEYMEDEYYE